MVGGGQLPVKPDVHVDHRHSHELFQAAEVGQALPLFGHLLFQDIHCTKAQAVNLNGLVGSQTASDLDSQALEKTESKIAALHISEQKLVYVDCRPFFMVSNQSLPGMALTYRSASIFEPSFIW